VAPRRLQDILALKSRKRAGRPKIDRGLRNDLGRARVGSAGAGSSRTAGPGHSHVVEDAAAHDACLVLGHGRLQLLWLSGTFRFGIEEEYFLVDAELRRDSLRHAATWVVGVPLARAFSGLAEIGGDSHRGGFDSQCWSNRHEGHKGQALFSGAA
jgi:hypothetical protein